MKYIALLQLLMVSNLSVSQTGNSGFQTKEIFRTPEAKQGVAVDADFFIQLIRQELENTARKPAL